jgi:hypothetical protein
MKQILTLAILALVAPLLTLAQPAQQVDFFANTPPAVQASQISTQRVGPAGTRDLYYWIVANYPIGNSFVAGPSLAHQAPDVMTGINYVQVSWPAVPGAISYDVLRTTTQTFPTGAVTIAAITGLINPLYINNTDTLTSYTLAVAPGIQGYLRLNNKDYTTPRYEMYPPYIQSLGIMTMPSTMVIFPAGAEPVCSVTYRGAVVFVQGAIGVADTFRICTKDAANVYAYRALY